MATIHHLYSLGRRLGNLRFRRVRSLRVLAYCLLLISVCSLYYNSGLATVTRQTSVSTKVSLDTEQQHQQRQTLQQEPRKQLTNILEYPSNSKYSQGINFHKQIDFEISTIPFNRESSSKPGYKKADNVSSGFLVDKEPTDKTINVKTKPGNTDVIVNKTSLNKHAYGQIISGSSVSVNNTPQINDVNHKLNVYKNTYLDSNVNEQIKTEIQDVRVESYTFDTNVNEVLKSRNSGLHVDKKTLFTNNNEQVKAGYHELNLDKNVPNTNVNGKISSGNSQPNVHDNVPNTNVNGQIKSGNSKLNVEKKSTDTNVNRQIKADDSESNVIKMLFNTNVNGQIKPGNTESNVEKKDTDTNVIGQIKSGNTEPTVEEKATDTQVNGQIQSGNTEPNVEKKVTDTQVIGQIKSGNTESNVEKKDTDTNVIGQIKSGNTEPTVEEKARDTHVIGQIQSGNIEPNIEKKVTDTQVIGQIQPGNTEPNVEKKVTDTNVIGQIKSSNTEPNVEKKVTDTNVIGQIQSDNTEPNVEKNATDTQVIGQNQSGNTEPNVEKKVTDTNVIGQIEFESSDLYVDKQAQNTNFAKLSSFVSNQKGSLEQINSENPKVILDNQSPQTYNFVQILPGASYKWQRVTENASLVIFAAYYNNHRKYGPVIQTILLNAETNGKKTEPGPSTEQLNLRCVLLYTSDKDGYYRTVTTNATPFYQWYGHHQKRYRPGHICCPLPDDKLPQAVTITTGSMSPLNQVTVQYQQLSRQPRTFTLCLSPLHFTTNIAKKLVHYVEMNKILGADYFYVYDFHVAPDVRKVLDFYDKRNDTTVIKWKLPKYLKGDDDVWYYAQTVALNDCFLRSKGNTKYLITTDLDEFIFPLGSLHTWNDMINTESFSCSYDLKCIVIDMSKRRSVIKNEKRMRISKQFELITLLYQQRQNSLYKGKVKSKVIIRPDCYDGVNVHRPMVTEANETMPHHVSSRNGVMYHYANPEANFINKKPLHDSDLEKTSMRFAAQLIKNVADVWRQIDRRK